MTPTARTPTPALSPALAQGFLRTGNTSGDFGAALDQQATVPATAGTVGAAGTGVPPTAAPAAPLPGGLPLGPRLSATTLNPRSEAETRRAIHKSAQDFESTTLGQMLQFISDTNEVDPDFGGGHGEEMFRQMLTTEYGKLMSKSGHTGIAGPVERELLRAQGLKPAPAAASPARTAAV